MHLIDAMVKLTPISAHEFFYRIPITNEASRVFSSIYNHIGQKVASAGAGHPYL